MSLKDVIEEWKGDTLKNVLLELYIDRDLSMDKVAKELKLSVGILYKWLKEYGISKNTDLWK